MNEEAAPIEQAPAPAPETATAVTAQAENAAPERDPNKVYTQDEVDKIAAKIKKNERYRTKREVEAYYQGRLESAPAPAAPPPAAAPAAEEKPPERGSFDSYEAFLEAKAEFTGRKAAEKWRNEQEAKAKAETEAKTHAEKVKAFQTKLAEKYPDLPDRIPPEVGNRNAPELMQAIIESDFGPDILNHFAGNPADFERIAALGTTALNREIGRLEARFESAAGKPTTTPTPAPSRAPAPIRAVGGTTVSTDDEPSHDKPNEWKAWRDRQVFKKRSQGQQKTA